MALKIDAIDMTTKQFEKAVDVLQKVAAIEVQRRQLTSEDAMLYDAKVIEYLYELAAVREVKIQKVA